MTNEELIQYYINLLIIQYKNLDKAPKHIREVVSKLIIYELAIQVRDGYNIDETLGKTAVGKQLDVLAKYVGVDRIVYGSSFTRTFFGYIQYGESSPYSFGGYVNYEENIPDVQFKRYQDSKESLYRLNDYELLTVLKLKILKNNSIGSVYDIDQFLDSFFNNQVLFFDSMNMIITYIFDSDLLRLVTIAVSENLIPRPAGIRLNIGYTPDVNNIFGYCNYEKECSDYMVGYGLYENETIGGFLQYGNSY